MSQYSRTSPFLTHLMSRYRLNKETSTKETWHVAVSLAGSEMTYRPGDSIGFCPENDHRMCEELLKACRFEGDESIEDPRSHETMSIRDYLRKKANLSVPTRKFLQELARIGGEGLEKIVQPGNEEALKGYLDLHNVFEVVQQHAEVRLQPQELVQNVQPLLPRLYSIASSQSVMKDEVHFTVSRVRYEVHGKKRLGVCSHFLCDMVKEGTPCVPIYLQQTKDFLLPEDNQVPLIMIGPGTGVAPFRAFMQERFSRSNPTTRNWLFFGERNRECDFFYEEFWNELVQKKFLRLDVAFSRDQEHKVYVQHKIWEHRKEFWKWLQDGAKIYVCGDANRMAKDVDKCLQDIIKEEEQISEESARHFLADLRRQKRYLRDIY